MKMRSFVFAVCTLSILLCGGETVLAAETEFITEAFSDDGWDTDGYFLPEDEEIYDSDWNDGIELEDIFVDTEEDAAVSEIEILSEQEDEWFAQEMLTEETLDFAENDSEEGGNDGVSGKCGEDLIWLMDPSSRTLTISGTGYMYDYEEDNQPWSAFKYDFICLVIEDGVENIGAYAFAGYSNLSEITFASSLKKIGEAAFLGCVKIEKVKLKEGLLEIGKSAFEKCSRMETIVFPSTLSIIGASAFRGAFHTYFGSNMQWLKLPESVSKIGDSAFADCRYIEAVRLPKNLSQINDSTFQGCTGLCSIEIPEAVGMIGVSAFEGCDKLINVEIMGENVRVLSKAFASCKDLQEIKFHGSYSHIEADCFDNTSAEAYYSNADSTWGGVPFTQFHGDITWSGVDQISDYYIEQTYYYGRLGTASGSNEPPIYSDFERFAQ